MSELGGAFRFQQLSVDEQAAYIEHAKKMTTFARSLTA